MALRYADQSSMNALLRLSRPPGAVGYSLPSAPSGALNLATGCDSSDDPADEHARREEAAEQYRRELLQKDPTEVEDLVRVERQKIQQEREAQAEIDEQQHFFNRPGMQPDYDHYCRCANWTLDEAVALSFGKDPERVNWKTVEPFARTSKFAELYRKRRDQTVRAKWAQQLFDPVMPGIFLSWSRQLEIKLPNELLTRAVNRGISLKSWHDLHDEAVDRHKKETAEVVEKYQGAIQQWRTLLSGIRDLMILALH